MYFSMKKELSRRIPDNTIIQLVEIYTFGQDFGRNFKSALELISASGWTIVICIMRLLLA